MLIFTVIFIVISTLFVNLKAGLIAVISNAFPIIVLFGVMGYAGIPVDTGTAMVAAISLGICVDHTMHFMNRYRIRGTTEGHQDSALSETVTEEAAPIFSTSLALAAGFTVFSLSQFPPVSMFGLLSALVMLLALIGSVVLTPLMLRYTPLISAWDILSVDLKGELVQQSALFRGMRNWQIRKLIAMSVVKKYEAFDYIVHQGETDDKMFLILEGWAEVWMARSDGSKFNVVTLGKGEIFGELAIVSLNERSADVLAITDLEVLVLQQKSILNINTIYPRIAAKLYFNLSVVIGNRLSALEPGGLHNRDEMSGGYSRSYFKDLLHFLIDKSNRYGEKLTLMLIEVRVNKEASDKTHQTSLDVIFRRLSENIEPMLRSADMYVRWDDGHSYVALPNTQPGDAQLAIQRITKKASDIVMDGYLDIGVSFKVISLQEGEGYTDLIYRAESEEYTHFKAFQNSKKAIPVPEKKISY